MILFYWKFFFRLVKENQIAEAEHVAYQLQVETLQKTINDQKYDIASLNEKIEDERHKHEEEKKKIETELKAVSRGFIVLCNVINLVNKKDATNVNYWLHYYFKLFICE